MKIRIELDRDTVNAICSVYRYEDLPVNTEGIGNITKEDFVIERISEYLNGIARKNKEETVIKEARDRAEAELSASTLIITKI